MHEIERGCAFDEKTQSLANSDRIPQQKWVITNWERERGFPDEIK